MATREELIAVQMEQYPESRIMTLEEVIGEWCVVPEYDPRTMGEIYSRVVFNNGEDYKIYAFSASRAKAVEVAFHTTKAVARALLEGDVVFYEVPTKTQTYRGARYGTEPREYFSGFGTN